MKTVIMAGGKGTRMAEKYPELPKPMLEVNGKPLLHHQIEMLASQGLTDITLVTGYKAEAIHRYFDTAEIPGVTLDYLHESTPLGTGGALALLPKQDILLLMGDLYFDVDFNRLVAYHRDKNAQITLFVHPNSHPYDSDLVRTEDDGTVTDWIFKSQPRESDLRNLVNAGIYVLSSEALPSPPVHKLDLDKELIAPAIWKHKGVYAYRSAEYVKDMGTPDRLAGLIADIEKGIPAARNLNRRQKAIFLDRDGVLNELAGFISTPDDLRLIEGVGAAVRNMNQSEYLAICITNQPVLARGTITAEQLERIHGRLDMLLAENGAWLDDLFYCPHHPDKGFSGEVAALKIDCDCRKPKPGLLLRAAEKYNIDLEASYMIGDMTADIAAGQAAGCKTIALRTGEGLNDKKYEVSPDLWAETLMRAVESILLPRDVCTQSL